MEIYGQLHGNSRKERKPRAQDIQGKSAQPEREFSDCSFHCLIKLGRLTTD